MTLPRLPYDGCKECESLSIEQMEWPCPDCKLKKAEARIEELEDQLKRERAISDIAMGKTPRS